MLRHWQLHGPTWRTTRTSISWWVQADAVHGHSWVYQVSACTPHIVLVELVSQWGSSTVASLTAATVSVLPLLIPHHGPHPQISKSILIRRFLAHTDP